MKAIENKIALVSAATQGIGLACVKNLAQNGAAVYIGGIRDKYAEAALAECVDLNVKFVEFDANDYDSYEQMMFTYPANA